MKFEINILYDIIFELDRRLCRETGNNFDYERSIEKLQSKKGKGWGGVGYRVVVL